MLTAIDQLVQLVSSDDELMSGVADIRDRDGFTAAVRGLAAERGINLTDEDIVGALRDARTAWLARWV